MKTTPSFQHYKQKGNAAWRFVPLSFQTSLLTPQILYFTLHLLLQRANLPQDLPSPKDFSTKEPAIIPPWGITVFVTWHDKNYYYMKKKHLNIFVWQFVCLQYFLLLFLIVYVGMVFLLLFLIVTVAMIPDMTFWTETQKLFNLRTFPSVVIL